MRQRVNGDRTGGLPETEQTKLGSSYMAATQARRDISPSVQRRRLETCRARIQTSKLIDRLQAHVMGQIDLSKTQVTAAMVLLRKTLPDLVAVRGDVDTPPILFNFKMGTMHVHA